MREIISSVRTKINRCKVSGLSKVMAFIFTLFCSFILVSVRGYAADEISLKGAGTSEDPYQISSAEELKDFRDAVNSYISDSKPIKVNYCAVLTSDIALEDENWIPIGKKESGSTEIQYTGTFDGEGHTISGLNINTNAAYRGLFSSISGAEIKNLTVKGSITTTYVGNADTGGIVGSATESVIDHVVSEVDISAPSGTRLGGIVGQAVQVTFVECIHRGSVEGYAKNNTTYAVGGIVGQAGNSTITRCENYGSVKYGFISDVKDTTKKLIYGAGGIVGVSSKDSISACYNGADITSETRSTGGIVGRSGGTTITTSYNSGKVIGANETGGIAGSAFSSPSSTIKACYNLGNILGQKKYELTGGLGVGGIIGALYSASSYVEVSNCYNIGVAEQKDGAGLTVGGIIGALAANATVNNSYYLTSQENGNEAAEGIIDKASDEMKTEEFVTLLGSDFVVDSIDVNNGYPIFQWMIDQKLVEDVLASISAIPADTANVTLDDENAINEAAAAFDALSDELKAQIPEETQKLLTDAKTKLEELKAAASKEEPASTGGSDNTPKPSAGGSSAPAPAKPVSLTAVKNLTISSNTGGKKLTLKCAKVKGATSYRIAYKLNNAKAWKYATTAKNSYVFTKVKKNGTLTVKVQAAVKSGSKTTYGAYSKVNYFLQNKTSLKKAAAGKKLAKVTWKKQAGVTGYQISYSLKKDFSKSSTKLVKGAKKTALTVKKLKSKKKYFVRIRPYKTVKGKKYYGAWSGVKTVKVK